MVLVVYIVVVINCVRIINHLNCYSSAFPAYSSSHSYDNRHHSHLITIIARPKHSIVGHQL